MYGAVKPEDFCGGEDASMECTVRPGRLFGVSTNDAGSEGSNEQTASSTGRAPSSINPIVQLTTLNW